MTQGYTSITIGNNAHRTDIHVFMQCN